MIRHVFSWRVAEGHSNTEIVDILNTLPDARARHQVLGDRRPRGDPGDNGAPVGGVLITDFESWEALDEYSNDPYHVSVVEKLIPRLAARAVVDFERSES